MGVKVTQSLSWLLLPKRLPALARQSFTTLVYSNATANGHSPDESLDIEAAKRFTSAMAYTNQSLSTADRTGDSSAAPPKHTHTYAFSSSSSSPHACLQTCAKRLQRDEEEDYDDDANVIEEIKKKRSGCYSLLTFCGLVSSSIKITIVENLVTKKGANPSLTPKDHTVSEPPLRHTVQKPSIIRESLESPFQMI
eukprot:scaffold6091_cov164-Amphora_coffeaeformis.AAC.15